MLKFDLKTIIFMSMLLTFMFSMMLAITRVHHKEIRGPAYWSVGNLVVGLGMVFVLIQLDSAKPIFLPSMALIGLGLSLYINGIQVFTNKPLDHRIPFFVFLLMLLIDGYLMRHGAETARENLRLMVVLDSVVFAAIYLGCARLSFTREEGMLANLFWIMSTLFVMLSLLMLLRAISAFHAPDSAFESFANWPVNAYTFMLGAFSQFFISALFMLMLSYRLNQNLSAMARMDGLTGVLNRSGLEDAALKMEGICKRINLCMAILLIDMDHFKKVNDQHGHLVGDDMLRHMAKVITGVMRSGDVLGRYGGEEFCILMPNTTEHDAAGLAERVRSAVESTPLVLGKRKIPVTVSIGVADSVRGGYAFKNLVGNADSALYQAKDAGRNRVISSSSLTAAQTGRTRH